MFVIFKKMVCREAVKTDWHPASGDFGVWDTRGGLVYDICIALGHLREWILDGFGVLL